MCPGPHRSAQSWTHAPGSRREFRGAVSSWICLLLRRVWVERRKAKSSPRCCRRGPGGGLLGLSHQRRPLPPHTDSVALGDSAGWPHPCPLSSETSRHPPRVEGMCLPCWPPTCPTGLPAPEGCKVQGLGYHGGPQRWTTAGGPGQHRPHKNLGVNVDNRIPAWTSLSGHPVGHSRRMHRAPGGA